jgi:hypothetical protein
MRKPNRPMYEAAQKRIASGDWRVDPDQGLVYGVRGEPFTGKRPGAKGGYVVCKPDAEHLVLVHRIVWEFVHGPIPDGLEVNHINGVKHDNRISNLEVVTHAENIRHALRTGLMKPPPGRTRIAKTECPTHGLEHWRKRSDGSRSERLVCKRGRMARLRAA